MALARASQPRMVEISWIRALTSLALAFADRSWLSLAWRHGWEETRTLAGRSATVVMAGEVGEVGHGGKGDGSTDKDGGEELV